MPEDQAGSRRDAPRRDGFRSPSRVSSSACGPDRSRGPSRSNVDDARASGVAHASRTSFSLATRSRQYAFIRSASLASASRMLERRRLLAALRREADGDAGRAVAPVETGRLRLQGGTHAELAVGQPPLARRRVDERLVERSIGTATVFDAVTENPSACSPSARPTRARS